MSHLQPLTPVPSCPTLALSGLMGWLRPSARCLKLPGGTHAAAADQQELLQATKALLDAVGRDNAVAVARTMDARWQACAAPLKLQEE